MRKVFITMQHMPIITVVLKNKIFILFFIFFTMSCAALEMLKFDPIMDFKQHGIRKALFLGFLPENNLKIDKNIINQANDFFLKEMKNLNSIDLITIDKLDIKLQDLASQLNFLSNKEQFKTIGKITDLDIIILGSIKNYIIKINNNIADNNYFGEPSFSDLLFKDIQSIQIYILFKIVLIDSQTGEIIWKKEVEKSGILGLNMISSLFIGNQEKDINYITRSDTKISIKTDSIDDKQIEKLQEGILKSGIKEITNFLLPYYNYRYYYEK